ncbi:hypothetical protein LIN78_12560 [Leeia sp. TBRC 13508]|uniref:Co-chaperone DjlA N-terminal domain-containing protein n=1 Tax=Leeia speluncae TaxID=2884804 RepID=A0ABS8D8N3_9NEIS|nr:hypothetical protein [Leeia speluncae]MCB6184378.1 hypothetical protein [Leeia speluncae]
MKRYEHNSPEAIARIIAMMIVTDAEVHPGEIDILETLNAYDVIGLTKEQFTQVFHDYLADISDEQDEEGNVHLVSTERLNHMLDDVTDPKKRLLTAAILLDVTKSDHELQEIEIAVFQHILKHWHLSLDDIEASIQAL